MDLPLYKKPSYQQLRKDIEGGSFAKYLPANMYYSMLKMRYPGWTTNEIKQVEQQISDKWDYKS